MTKKRPEFTNHFYILITAGLLVLLGGVFTLFATPSAAQDGNNPTEPAGTLVPPTLVPTPPGTPIPEVAVVSGIATMQQEGIWRIGTLYNVPPFAWLTETGRVLGYEAEVVEALAVDLGVEVEYIQVTAETQETMLLNGEVDSLIGQQMHTKQAEEQMEFSHPYYYNRQRMVIREGSPYGAISDLAGQPISVVAGSRGEAALGQWMAQHGANFEIVRHLSQDAALDALANNEVEGMVGEEDDLIRAGRLQMSFVGEYISQDPYAIAFRRHDVNLRNAVNRSLQRLYASGRLAEIAENWFPDESINFAAFIPVYQSLYEDDRSVEDFPPDVPMPDRSIMDKIANSETLQVAGLSLNDSAPGYQRYLDVFNRELMLEMGRRWGVNINFVPDTYGLAADALSQNMADVGVGVAPRWDGADRVNYSLPYHYRSDRIIGLEGGRYGSINDFRTGSWIGYYEDTPTDFERLEEIKEALNLTFDIYRFPNNSRVTEMFGSRDIDALFADNIRLQYLVENSNLPFSFYERNWSFEPIVLAVPRNDADFLSLVNWTLSEMYADGTITRIWQEYYASYIDTQFGGNAINDWIPNWPGDGQFLYDKWFNE